MIHFRHLASISILFAGLLVLAQCSSDSDDSCTLDTDCPGTQVCRNGECVSNPCGTGCPSGEYCDGDACVECTDDRHCGANCIDCTALDTNRACVAGECGCDTAADCAAGEECADRSCTSCAPDCSGKCGGADDGCGGTCTDCPNAQWCDILECKACNTAEHCGWECTDCASQARNQACVNGQCGCLLATDCAAGDDCVNGNCSGCTPDCVGKCGGASDGCDDTCNSCNTGEWCDNQVCKPCDTDDHCGSTCTDCAGQSNNQACVGGDCGCVDDNDCATGESCESGDCTGCIPDCAGKCGGSSDGCTGTCDSCPAAQWCDGQECKICNTDDHCGWTCDDCTGQSSNQVCVSGACGCVTDAECAAGEWCDNNTCSQCLVDDHCGNTVCVDCTDTGVEGSYCAGSGGDRYCACIDAGDCAGGRWCNVDTCQDCDDDEHCGSGCINCANQGNNQACVGGVCGCVDADDCSVDEICENSSCTGCTPDCTDKCGGVSDGCLGTCDADCEAGKWCNNQACEVCNVDAHCGAACTDCTDTGVNGDHCFGNVGGYYCACDGISACLTGYYCDSPPDGICTACDTDQHCGPDCTDCSAQTNNKKCVGGQCGCISAGDCDTGYTCSGGTCQAPPDEVCDNGVDDDDDLLEDCEDVLDCPNGTDCAGSNRVCSEGLCIPCWEIYCTSNADCRGCNLDVCNTTDNCCANSPTGLCP